MAIFDEIVLNNNYDLDLVPFTPDQIFDCGGHIGMFSLIARGRYPLVPLINFEPNLDLPAGEAQCNEHRSGAGGCFGA